MPTDEPKDIYTILSEIKTVEDLNKNEKLILETTVSEFVAGLEAMKALAKSPRPPPEVVMEFEQIKVDQEALKADINEQFDRISQIPSADDIILSIRGELVGRMGAITSQMMEVFGELMSGPLSGGSMSEATPKKEYEKHVYTGYDLPEGETIEALDTVRSIRSKDDFINKKDKLVNQIHEMYKSELTNVIELKSMELPPEELKANARKLQTRVVYIAIEMANEFNRLDALIGSSDLVIELSEELAANTQPIAEQIMQVFEEFGLGKMEEQNIEMSSEYETVGEERVELAELTEIYEVNSLEDFKENKEKLYDSLQSSLERNLRVLKDVKDGIFPPEEVPEKVAEVDKHMNVIGSEMDIELSRIEKIPGGLEYVKAFREESMTRFGPVAEEIMKLLEELKNK